VQSVADALGRETLFSYDQLGRPQTVTDALGRVGVFAYPVPGGGAIVGPSVYAGNTGRFEDESRNYNTELDLTSSTGWSNPLGTANYTYTRDTAGRPTAIATTFQGLSGASVFNTPGPGCLTSITPRTVN
jgi:YD repeat-containing protein